MCSLKLNIRKDCIQMPHGSGGRAMQTLISEIFHPAFDNSILSQGNDQAIVDFDHKRLVVCTDAHVISPLFFPGGDIGCLSVHGTINDIVMSGAKPLYITASFILEEGLRLSELQSIAQSMGKAARSAGVRIIAGDTKVVERGKGDGVFISTTGVGYLNETLSLSGNQAQPGDLILINGYIGDHGVAIMAQRNHLQFETDIISDTAALHDLVAAMIDSGARLRCLRDPTRGGLATSLNELAHQSKVGMIIEESMIPIRREVASACELLGLDPLYAANEGKVIAICPRDDAEQLLMAMRCHPLGGDAKIIGEVVDDEQQFVQLNTNFGGSRVVDWLMGEPLPRIC